MKTITLDEEAYGILATLKIDPKDSFSKVVKRHFRKAGRIRSSSGSWSDVTDEKVAVLRRETLGAFEPHPRRR